MTDEMKELLAFLVTAVIGMIGAGVMLGHAAGTGNPTWTAVSFADLTAMLVVFAAALRWFRLRRAWELENIGPLFEEVGD